MIFSANKNAAYYLKRITFALAIVHAASGHADDHGIRGGAVSVGGRPGIDSSLAQLPPFQQNLLGLAPGRISPTPFASSFSALQGAQTPQQRALSARRLVEQLDNGELFDNAALQNQDGGFDFGALSELGCLPNLGNQGQQAFNDALRNRRPDLFGEKPAPDNGGKEKEGGDEHVVAGSASPVRTGVLAGVGAGAGSGAAGSSPVRRRFLGPSNQPEKDDSLPGRGGDGANNAGCDPPGQNQPPGNNQANPGQRNAGNPNSGSGGNPPGNPSGAGGQFPQSIPGQPPPKAEQTPPEMPPPQDIKPYPGLKLPTALEEKWMLDAIAGIKVDGSYDSTPLYKDLDALQKRLADMVPKPIDPPATPTNVPQFQSPPQQAQATPNYNASKFLNLPGTIPAERIWKFN